MQGQDRLERRVTDLELLFTHLERQVAELHQVILRQQQSFERLELLARRLSQAQEDAPDDDTEP